MEDVDIEGHLHGLDWQLVLQLLSVELAVLVHGGVVRLCVSVAEELERILLPVLSCGSYVCSRFNAHFMEASKQLFKGESLLLSNGDQSIWLENAKRVLRIRIEVP